MYKFYVQTLRDNRLGFGCAEQIGEVMKTNSTLTHLTLSGGILIELFIHSV